MPCGTSSPPLSERQSSTPSGPIALLEERLEHLEVPGFEAAPAPPVGEAAWADETFLPAGGTCHDQPALLGVDVAADDGGWRIALREAESCLSARFGPDRWIVTKPRGDNGVPLACKGGWVSPGTLRCDVVFLETPHRLVVFCKRPEATFSVMVGCAPVRRAHGRLESSGLCEARRALSLAVLEPQVCLRRLVDHQSLVSRWHEIRCRTAHGLAAESTHLKLRWTERSTVPDPVSERARKLPRANGMNLQNRATMIDPARPVQSFYVPVADGVRLAIDIWLPVAWIGRGERVGTAFRATRYHRASSGRLVRRPRRTVTMRLASWGPDESRARARRRRRSRHSACRSAHATMELGPV